MEELTNEIVETATEETAKVVDSYGVDGKSMIIGVGLGVGLTLAHKYVIKPIFGKIKNRKKKDKYITVPNGKNEDEDDFEEESDE